MPADPSLSLSEVLRRCHRDELLPLAAVLKVNPLGLGRDRLAYVLETGLRGAGANKVENIILRQGKGPEYPRVLSDLARRQGIAVEYDTSGTELALLHHWRLEGAPDERQNHALVRVIGPDPVRPSPRVHSYRKKRGPMELIWTILIGALRTFAPLIGPLAPIALLLWLSRPRDELLLPALLEVALLRQKVARRFTIGVVGPPSSGKDAALAALFGIRTGNVHPVAGSTKEVTVYLLPGTSGLQVVNTPGVGDVLERLTEEARNVLDQIDLFLFLVNSQGGVRTREKNEYLLCRSRQRPVLVVVNKIDTLKPEDRARFINDVRLKLGLPAGSVVGAAFDPLPQLAPEPIGVDTVRAWLKVRLGEMGRDPDIIQG